MNPTLDVLVLATGAGCAGMLVGWLFANCFPLRDGGVLPEGRQPRARVIRIDVAAAHARKRRSNATYLGFQY